jgi:hypothetical protein
MSLSRHSSGEKTDPGFRSCLSEPLLGELYRVEASITINYGHKNL